MLLIPRAQRWGLQLDVWSEQQSKTKSCFIQNYTKQRGAANPHTSSYGIQFFTICTQWIILSVMIFMIFKKLVLLNHQSKTQIYSLYHHTQWWQKNSILTFEELKRANIWHLCMNNFSRWTHWWVDWWLELCLTRYFFPCQLTTHFSTTEQKAPATFSTRLGNEDQRGQCAHYRL